MTSIPNINVPEAQKDTKWIKECALWISKSGCSKINKKEDIENWKYYRNDFPENRMDYFLKFGKYTLPAQPRHIPLQRHLIDLLISELTVRHREFDVHTVDEESIDAKFENIIMQMLRMMEQAIDQYKLISNVKISTLDQKVSLIQEAMSKEPENEREAQEQERMKSVMPSIIAQMQMLQENAKSEQDYFLETAEKVDQYFKYTYKEMKEQRAEGILKYLYKLLRIKVEEKKAFRSKVVVGKQCYFIDYQDDERYPRFESLDDLKVFYPKISGVDRIQKGPWVVIAEYMTPQQIAIEFGDELSSSALDEIMKDEGSNSYDNVQMGSTPEGGIEVNSSSQEKTEGGILVQRVYYKSPRKETIKRSPNAYEKDVFFRHILDPYMQIINEDEYRYDPRKRVYINKKNPKDIIRKEDSEAYSLRKGDQLEYRWTNDIYEATVIKNEYVVKARKKNFVTRSIDKHSDVNLPVFGPTDEPYSLIRATLDMQKLYDVLYTHTELMVALAGVKSFFMDKSQRPDSMSPEEWEYQKKLGVINVQSMTADGAPKRTTFNQWQAIDLSLSPAISYVKDVLDRLEISMGNIIGIPPQRQAQVKDTDQVGTFKESIKRSYLITEILYSDHEDILEEALSHLVMTAARYSFRNGGKLEINERGLGRRIMVVPPKDLEDVDLRVYMERSGENTYKMEELKQIAAAHYKNGQLPFSNLLDIFSAQTLSELKMKVEYFTKEAQKLAAENAKADREAMRQLEIEKIRYANEFESFWRQKELEVEGFKAQFEVKHKEFMANIEQERLDLEKAMAEADAKLKLFELTNEKESEDNAVRANMTVAEWNAKLKAIEIKLNYLMNSANIVVQKDKNEKDHSEKMKKIDTDLKAKKIVKEHVSDR